MNINKKLAMLSLFTAVASSAAFSMPGKDDETSNKSKRVAAMASQRLQNLNAEKDKALKSKAPEAQDRANKLTEVIAAEKKKVSTTSTTGEKKESLTEAPKTEGAKEAPKAAPKALGSVEDIIRESLEAAAKKGKTTEEKLLEAKKGEEAKAAPTKILDLDALSKKASESEENLRKEVQNVKAQLTAAHEALENAKKATQTDQEKIAALAASAQQFEENEAKLTQAVSGIAAQLTAAQEAKEAAEKAATKAVQAAEKAAAKAVQEAREAWEAQSEAEVSDEGLQKAVKETWGKIQAINAQKTGDKQKLASVLDLLKTLATDNEIALSEEEQK